MNWNLAILRYSKFKVSQLYSSMLLNLKSHHRASSLGYVCIQTIVETAFYSSNYGVLLYESI